MGVSFSKGDEIALTGSKVKQDGAALVPCPRSGEGEWHARAPRREGQPCVELATQEL